MKYKNPSFRKTKGSYMMIVSCGYCKTDIAKYQKVGRGNVLRMYVNRIVESSIDVSKHKGALHCPNCGEQIATRIILRKRDKEAYKMIRATYNVRRINS